MSKQELQPQVFMRWKKHAVLHSHFCRAASDASFHADSATSVRRSDYDLVEHSFGTHFRRNPGDDIDKDSARPDLILCVIVGLDPTIHFQASQQIPDRVC
ncbi:hypothetical protein [uncultured Treponema sp.]|uniref:hypothetical protein n=1 Tax=Treponema sp. TaxID=166 RepID=UPI0025E416DE|nr:hypothetical protein [uncultured Treponema sp.]